MTCRRAKFRLVCRCLSVVLFLVRPTPCAWLAIFPGSGRARFTVPGGSVSRRCRARWHRMVRSRRQGRAAREEARNGARSDRIVKYLQWRFSSMYRVSMRPLCPQLGAGSAVRTTCRRCGCGAGATSWCRPERPLPGLPAARGRERRLRRFLATSTLSSHRIAETGDRSDPASGRT